MFFIITIIGCNDKSPESIMSIKLQAINHQIFSLDQELYKIADGIQDNLADNKKMEIKYNVNPSDINISNF